MFNVQTKYIPATNTSGARVRATVFRQPNLPAGWKRTKNMGYNHALSASQNHFEVLSRLLHHWDQMDMSASKLFTGAEALNVYSPRRYDAVEVKNGYLWSPVSFEPFGQTIYRQLNDIRMVS